MPPGLESITDSGKLESYLRRVTAGSRYSFTYRTQEIRTHGELGMERGNYVLSFESDSKGNLRTESGNLVRILERRPNGDWRIAIEIWNVVLSSGER